MQNIIKPGVRLNKVYETVVAILKDKKSELIQHLHKELGWSMGYEIREKRFVLDEKNKHTFHAGMVICLRLGLENLEQKGVKGQTQKYALLIADTLLVTADGCELITTAARKATKVYLFIPQPQPEIIHFVHLHTTHLHRLGPG